MTKVEPIGIGGLHRGLSIPEIYIENTKLHDEIIELRKENNQLQSNWNSLREDIKHKKDVLDNDQAFRFNIAKKDGDDYVYNVYKYMIALEKNEDVSDFDLERCDK